MPLSNYDPEFEGAVGVRIGPATLSQVGTIAHRDAARETNAPVERSFVIGDRLYTLSWHGIASNGLGDLGRAAVHGLLKRGAAAPGGEGFQAPRL